MKCSVCGITDLRIDNESGICAVRPECMAKRTRLWREARNQELADLRALADQVKALGRKVG